MKELIYTGIFVALGILLILLLVYMFSPKEKNAGSAEASDLYLPGVYTSSIMLGVAVTVSADTIESIRLTNISETVETMYPLVQPALESLASQICSSQSLENLTVPQESQYTSQILIDAVSRALQKASAAEGEGDEG